jgi:UDP-N-acetylglucosamine transferase subunit ALG13
MSTCHFPFSRFVSYVYSVSETLSAEVVLQTGRFSSTLLNPSVKYVEFLTIDDFERICGQADLVISQAGIGVVVTCLSVGTPLILVPRVSRFGETETDHQSEMHQIVRALGVDDRVIVVDDLEGLTRAARILYGKRFPRREVGELPGTICRFLLGKNGDLASSG